MPCYLRTIIFLLGATCFLWRCGGPRACVFFGARICSVTSLWPVDYPTFYVQGCFFLCYLYLILFQLSIISGKQQCLRFLWVFYYRSPFMIRNMSVDVLKKILVCSR